MELVSISTWTRWISSGNSEREITDRYNRSSIDLPILWWPWRWVDSVIVEPRTDVKEIRLELDESKLNGIIMELDILHRAVAPEIVEFYGAFTIESCVYYCMELMDAGSLDTLTGGGVPANQVKAEDEAAELRVPEDVLRRITGSIVRGLKFLKDELQIMHRGQPFFLW
jgi:serine/threonine protein kinase